MSRGIDTVTSGPSKEVVSIQQLRGFAAMLVVLHHALGAMPWLYNPLAGSHFGEAGVDIFFVISGFIMVVAARTEAPREFFAKRALRVVPLYWIATLIFILMRMSHFGEPDLTATTIAKSLLFIPYRADPAIWYTAPVLIPGWSLNIELLFYAIFGIGLSVKRPVAVSAVVVTMLAIIGLVFRPQQEILLTYTRPILLEFVAGMLLATAYLRSKVTARMAPALIVGLSLVLFSDFLDEPWSRVARGVGGFLIVTGSLSLEPAFRRFAGLRQVGDASYAIYLFHTMILMILRKLFEHVPIHGPLQFGAFVATALIASAAGGYAVHILLEKPLTKMLRRSLFRREPARQLPSEPPFDPSVRV